MVGRTAARHHGGVTNEREYILGTQRDELDRLRFQHEVWAEHSRALWREAGIGQGQVVLDLGCGPGFTTLELARAVGPLGSVIGRDLSARFLQHLAAEAERVGATQVETSVGAVEELDLDSVLDAAYSRWVLCWMPDAGVAVERIARALKPGGVFALHEYWDWAAMKLVPRSEAFERAVAAAMEGWRVGGATIDVGERLPALAREHGLAVELLRPVARVGPPGSPVWRWVQEFFRVWLPKLAERGLLTRDEVARALADHERLAADADAWFTAPTLVEVVLRKR